MSVRACSGANADFALPVHLRVLTSFALIDIFPVMPSVLMFDGIAILPQNEHLRRGWRDMLGQNWKDIQKTWVHRLGNLTLTGYNSTYSDRDFDDKKTIEGGFEDSSLYSICCSCITSVSLPAISNPRTAQSVAPSLESAQDALDGLVCNGFRTVSTILCPGTNGTAPTQCRYGFDAVKVH